MKYLKNIVIGGLLIIWACTIIGYFIYSIEHRESKMFDAYMIGLICSGAFIVLSPILALFAEDLDI